MAGKYSKAELKEMLHRSAYHIVATEGIEGVTVRKVSRGCGLSDPYIYQCYSDMRELLTAAYFEVDRAVAAKMGALVQLEQIRDEDLVNELNRACWHLWSAYWDFLMEDPEKTVFYWRFYQSGYYNQKILAVRRGYYGDFIAFVERTGRRLKLQDKVDLDIVISNVIDCTLSVVVKTLLGYLQPNSVAPVTVYQSLFAMVFHYIGIDIWKQCIEENQNSSIPDGSV